VKRRIVLGTRGSDLARTQARMAESALRARWPDLEIETKIIKTSGDESVTIAESQKTGGQSLPAAAGRKGLFTAEIERALLAERIDIAVHSAKDLPSALNPETRIAAALPRASVDDVLISLNGYDLESLPRNGVVATGSVRRRYQIQWKRPDLEIVDLRGNVPTRLRKLTREPWHGAILARAGLERLEILPNGSPIMFESCKLTASTLPLDVFIPAGGQGIVGIQIRANDNECGMLLEPITELTTYQCLRAEREFLRLLHGDCNQPVGVFATVNGNVMKIRGQIFRPGTGEPRQGNVEGRPDEAEHLAADLLKAINGHEK
jgi:hydroxymethylbilane synthase